MDKFELARIHNRFETLVMEARDKLGPIISGEIDRRQCPPGTRECYGGERGKRKTTLKDAREIAKAIVGLLDRGLNEFYEATRGI